MLVKVDKDLKVTVQSRNSFDKFSIEIAASRSDIAAAKTALSEIGVFEDENYLWVNEVWLRRVANVANDMTWQDNFSKMILNAKKYGWVDENANRIRGHIRWL